jgi:urea transport system substrate-binding protein
MAQQIQRRDFLRLAGGVGAAAFIGTSLAACAPPTTGGGDKDGLKLGFLTSFTGLEAVLAAAQFQSFELAVNQLNGAGGAGGRTITFVKEDDAADSKQTIEKANKLAYSDRVNAVVGLVASLEREAALTVLPAAKTPLFYTTYYEGSYLDANACDPYYVATGQVPNQQIDPLVPWLTDNVGTKYFVVGSDYIWPRGTSIRLKELVAADGGSVAGEQYFPFGTTDFSQVLREIDSSGADVAWITLAGTDFLTFLTQAHQFGLKAKLVSIGMDDVFAHANPDAAAGVIASQAYFRSIETDANAAFLDAYSTAYGADAPVNAIGVAAYNAVHLIAAAVEKADSVDTDTWMAEISNVEFDSPMGLVKVSATNQNTTCANYIGEVQADGSISILSESAAVEPDLPGCSL